jgi:hypothetical protein
MQSNTDPLPLEVLQGGQYDRALKDHACPGAALRGSVLLCIPSSWKWRVVNGGFGPPRSWLRSWLVIGVALTETGDGLFNLKFK